MSRVFDEILKKRGLDNLQKRADFLSPEYAKGHNPFLLPDMVKAVERLVLAHERQDRITIYGDYDIDGLTATTVLLDAFESFGFQYVDAFIPNRFIEGYGLTVEAIERIAKSGAQLIITVDCGSLSEKEITKAKELGVDVIVTDHHNVAPVQPPAVAVINPKRLLQDYPEEYEDLKLKTGSKRKKELYPFLDLPGVGVAFKLVQALQSRLSGLPKGQEKWLLDLVALGTVCDVVTLQDENRTHVYWGLKVLAKTRRPGLRALMAVADVDPSKINARSLGFALGPRMNAAGRLETAVHSLEMLRSNDGLEALEKARKLDEMNSARRTEQDKILRNAIIEVEKHREDPVLVVSAQGWSHGIIGIVAAKLLEKYGKPTYVLEEMGDEAKGSARSYGDFSVADAIRASDHIISGGGGHKLAAGVTIPVKNIQAFRQSVNDYYREQGLVLLEQQQKLLPIEDVSAQLTELTEELLLELESLEPFGQGNSRPVLKSENLTVKNVCRMGNDGQHVKLTLSNGGAAVDFLAFSAPKDFFVDPGTVVTIWYTPEINEWRGSRSVEGRILHLSAN